MNDMSHCEHLTILVRVARRAPRALGARAGRGQAAGRGHHRDARRSLPAGGRRSRSRSPRCRTATRTRTSSRPSRRWCSRSNRADAAGVRRARSGDRVAAAAGAAVAQRAASSAVSRETSTPRRRSRSRTSPTSPPTSCARSGDIHPLGNPHYWIPPGTRAALPACWPSGSRRSTPAGRAPTRRGWPASSGRLDAKKKDWDKAAAPLHGLDVVTLPQELVVRGRVARDAGGRLHRAEAGHSARPPTHTAQLIALMRSRT